MPKWLDDCVTARLADKKFYPKRKDRESLAYAICQDTHKKDKAEIGIAEEYLTTEHCICPNCGNEMPAKADTNCNEVRCPDCSNYMIAKERKSIPMRITKATIRKGGMYWQGVISDDDWDKEDERLSLSIFDDFKSHIIEQRQKADYQPPFVSLSHYDRGDDNSGVLGTVEDVWTHGRECTTDGWFENTRLGKRCFEVVRTELELAEKGEKIEDPVRFSVGFIPKETTQEDNRTVYLRGILDHVALTRVPINPRTGFTYVETKSMAKTRKEDAITVVGEEYEDDVDELEKHQSRKADLSDIVIKAEEEDSPLTQEQDTILRAALLKADVDEAELIEKAWDYAYKKSLPDSAYAWVEKGEECDEDGKTPQKCRHLLYKDKSGKVDCAHVRAALQVIGGARTGQKMSVPSGVKQKLRKALKSCQGEKADVLDTEPSEYEEGRMDGFNAALDMDIEEVEEMKEEKAGVEEVVKTEIDLDAVINELKPVEPVPEAKAVVEEIHPIDHHVSLLRQAIAAEGYGRSQKLEWGETILRSLAAYVAAEINESTPASPEDIAKSMNAQLAEVMKPLYDEIALLKAAVTGQAPDAPVSKALGMKRETFAINPEKSFMDAQGEGGADESRIKKIARASVGLDELL